jgi:threonine dehydrogenase-like Zn-dependent dehydrogenase
MKALVWTGVRNIEIQQLPDPEVTANHVIIRPSYVGICGSDLSGFLGEHALQKAPLVFGHEFTGEVVAVGPGVNHLHTGDVVAVNPLTGCGQCEVCRRGLPQYCPDRKLVGVQVDGAFAEYVSVPAVSCFNTGDALTAVVTEPLACGVRAARQADVHFDDDVVIYGAGMIGLFCAQAARWMGARSVVLVDTNSKRLQHGERFGASHLVNPLEGAAREQIGDHIGRAPNKVIDAVGLDVTRREGVDIAACGAKLVWIGLHQNDTTVPGNIIVRKEAAVVGSYCYTEDDFRAAYHAVEAGLVPVDETWLDVRMADTVQSCFEEQIDGPATYPKLVLTFWDDMMKAAKQHTR